MNTEQSPAIDENMPAEIDFSQGVRGKFYQANLKLNLPVYLDENVQNFAAIAEEKGIPHSDVANDLLKKAQILSPSIPNK